MEGNANNGVLDHRFHYNNEQPFSTIDKSSNQYGSICANNDQYG